MRVRHVNRRTTQMVGMTCYCCSQAKESHLRDVVNRDIAEQVEEWFA